MLLSRPDSKVLHDFARLPTAFHRGFEPRTSNRVYLIEEFEVAPHIIRKGKILWKHEIKKESTHGSHVILLTCY